jgi:hypothetical protein
MNGKDGRRHRGEECRQLARTQCDELYCTVNDNPVAISNSLD